MLRCSINFKIKVDFRQTIALQQSLILLYKNLLLRIMPEDGRYFPLNVFVRNKQIIS